MCMYKEKNSQPISDYVAVGKILRTKLMQGIMQEFVGQGSFIPVAAQEGAAEHSLASSWGS